jgi:hypothetical protein
MADPDPRLWRPDPTRVVFIQIPEARQDTVAFAVAIAVAMIAAPDPMRAIFRPAKTVDKTLASGGNAREDKERGGQERRER